MAQAVLNRRDRKKRNFNLPGESSDTGVLDGVGLCPGGRKCEGDPLLEPPPVPLKRKTRSNYDVNCQFASVTHLHEDFDVKDYGHLDLVHRVAFRQHLALVLLSSSSYTLIDDFETKFSPINRDRWKENKKLVKLWFCVFYANLFCCSKQIEKMFKAKTACKQISLWP